MDWGEFTLEDEKIDTLIGCHVRAIKTNMKLAKLHRRFWIWFSAKRKWETSKGVNDLGLCQSKEECDLTRASRRRENLLAVGLAVHAIKNRHTAYFLSTHELIGMIKNNIRSGKIRVDTTRFPCKPNKYNNFSLTLYILTFWITSIPRSINRVL